MKNIETRKPRTVKRARTIKKIPDLLEEKEYTIFQYIKEHQNSLNIKKACKILNVSRFIIINIFLINLLPER